MSSTKKIDLVSNEGLHFLSALSLQNVALANQIQELKRFRLQNMRHTVYISLNSRLNQRVFEWEFDLI